MLKENIKVSELDLSNPLTAGFRITFADIYDECHSVAEVTGMVRLFKQLAIQRQDYATASEFRTMERKLRQQAAEFEATWAWMNAQQMEDQIKKQVAALIPTISFRPQLGTIEKSKVVAADDGPTPFMTAEGA